MAGVIRSVVAQCQSDAVVTKAEEMVVNPHAPVGIQVIFFAIAFKITSCSFIIRSSSAAGIAGCLGSKLQFTSPLFQSGQLTC